MELMICASMVDKSMGYGRDIPNSWDIIGIGESNYAHGIQ